jgi:hypothetical protein
VLDLFRGWRYVLLTNCSLLRRAGPGRDTPRPAVIADAVHRDVVVDYGLVVGVVHHCDIHVGYGAVIDKGAAPPIPARIPHTV